MLKDLDFIDWQLLTHAYGPANDIPDLLKALASSDPGTWEEALQKLYGTLWHQGTVYQATVVAIPFLLELLEDKQVQCRDQIVLYLAELALASSDDQDMQWAKKTHEAVAQGLPLYLNLLKNAELDVKIYVPYVLATLEEQVHEIIPFIQACFLQETESLVKASLVMYLSYQAGYARETNRWLSKAVKTENEELLVNVIVALALTRERKANISFEIIQLLLNALTHPHPLEELYRQLPWPHVSNRTLLADITDAFLLLDFQWADHIIPILLQTLAHLNHSYQQRGSTLITDVAVLPVIRALLYFTFEGKPLKENALPFLLTNTQRSVLLTILDTEVALIFLDSLVEIMTSFGLPPHWKLRILLR